MTSPAAFLRIAGSLTKFRLCLLIAYSGAFGYLLHRPALDSRFFIAILGLLLIAMGAAAVNNVQDADIDREMARTRNRPTATGAVSAPSALLAAAALFLAGAFLLFRADPSGSALLLAFLSVGIYNGIYTPLKRRTTLALIPGAICGALPLLVGWRAAAPGLAHPSLSLALAVMVVWQFPHFFLILLRHREDYDAASASEVPNHLRLFHPSQLSRIVLLWTASYAVLTLSFPAFGIVGSAGASLLIGLNAAFLGAAAVYHLFLGRSARRYGTLFMILNQSLAIFSAVVVLDRFF